MLRGTHFKGKLSRHRNKPEKTSQSKAAAGSSGLDGRAGRHKRQPSDCGLHLFHLAVQSYAWLWSDQRIRERDHGYWMPLDCDQHERLDHHRLRYQWQRQRQRDLHGGCQPQPDGADWRGDDCGSAFDVEAAGA